MVYLYTEDSKAGFDFWKFICNHLFFDEIEVRNLGDNSNCDKLANFVCNLKDRKNTYLIAYDLSFDNKSIMENYEAMSNHIRENDLSNVIL